MLDRRQLMISAAALAGTASLPAKASAYREAFQILTRHTGETPHESKPKHDPEDHPALF